MLRPSPLKIFLLLLLLSFLLFIFYFFFSLHSYKPLYCITAKQAPDFSDDMDYHSLLSAAQSHIEFLEKHGSNVEVFPAEKTPSAGDLLQSIHKLTEILRQNPTSETLHRFIIDNYDIYQAGGREGKKDRQMLVTGYCEPVFEGSLTRTKRFSYPIYSPPDDLIQETDSDNKTRTGRLVGNVFHKYWSREEIEKLGLLKGNELAWLKDPFDAFLLHIQGSGRIRLPDNSLRAVHFASSNGLEYNSIGKLLVDEKKIVLKEVTIPTIRGYLDRHPEELQRILHHNPRFIFFNWGDNRGPRGSSGVVLTPGRSIAIDNSVLPNGVIGYLSTTTPKVNRQGEITGWTALKRFVFPQDSGSAIKGAGRVDLFWGHDSYAEIAANHMKEKGKLYFLVQKRSAEKMNQSKIP